MKAVVSKLGEGPQGVRVMDVPAPTCGPEEIVVDVKATALNRADLLQTMGLYPAPPGVPAEIPGLEYSGVVAAVGARVTRWKQGDRVMGIVAGGAWAEQLVTHEREALAIPKALDFAAAAAVPEAFITAYDALVTQAGMTRGHQVLVHAVTSGVGTAALQLCRFFGATPIGTGRSEAKLERATKLGLTHAVLVKNDTFAARVKQLTQGAGCDIALDLVGASYFPETLDALARGGVLMVVGFVGGVTAEVPLRTILSKKLHVIGTTLRSRPLEEKILAAREFEARVVPGFDQGLLVPVVDSTLPMTSIAAALERMANNDTFGKLVLTW